jgi:hypothetical protein
MLPRAPFVNVWLITIRRWRAMVCTYKLQNCMRHLLHRIQEVVITQCQQNLARKSHYNWDDCVMEGQVRDIYMKLTKASASRPFLSQLIVQIWWNCIFMAIAFRIRAYKYIHFFQNPLIYDYDVAWWPLWCIKRLPSNEVTANRDQVWLNSRFWLSSNQTTDKNGGKGRKESTGHMTVPPPLYISVCDYVMCCVILRQ